ncbi:hypothetical protein WR43_13865 [Mycolicibacter arupensis]|uniref:DUF2742 domain-containing protein n=1 Tax=Mycolicibacter arupensis TaxID=342002 RepID=A0A0F5MUY5_9MYCO|nr:hypothetical protein WR43_13865 [Mycolicibacter arupensis]OQZ94097.1 hypothetical protein BST15_17185 [Mycolicibacter arupensis]
MVAAPKPVGTTTRSNALTGSRQVSWWPVHEFLEAAVTQANCGQLPIAGTPSWQALADTDLAKLMALAVAGEHHVLRIETDQEHRADAAKVIARAEDWPAVSRQIRAGRGGPYVPRLPHQETA